MYGEWPLNFVGGEGEYNHLRYQCGSLLVLSEAKTSFDMGYKQEECGSSKGANYFKDPFLEFTLPIYTAKYLILRYLLK